MVRRPIVSLGYTLALVNVAVGGRARHALRGGLDADPRALGAAPPGPRVDQRDRVRVAGHRRDAAPLPADRPGRADRPASERGDRGARDRDGDAGRGRLGCCSGSRRSRVGERRWWWSGRWRRRWRRHGSCASEAAGRPIPAGTGSRPWGCWRGWPGSSSASRWLPGCWSRYGATRRGMVDRDRGGAARRRLDRAGADGLVDAPAAVDRPGHAGRSTGASGRSWGGSRRHGWSRSTAGWRCWRSGGRWASQRRRPLAGCSSRRRSSRRWRWPTVALRAGR